MTHLNGWKPASQSGQVSSLVESKLPSLLTKLNGSVIAQGAGFSVDLRPGCSPVENQQDIGSCVANAVVSDLEYLQIMQTGQYVDLSRMFVYYNARLLHNDTDKDGGSYVSLAMDSLKHQGVCPEAVCPYNTANVFMRPSWDSYRDAFAHTLSEYYKIDSVGAQRHSDIRAALDTKHPVVFGTPVWSAIQNVGSDGMLPMPDSSTSIGGHALLIVGYDLGKNVYIIRNSWGVNWGDQGYCYMPMSYIDAAGADDFHVGTLFR